MPRLPVGDFGAGTATATRSPRASASMRGRLVAAGLALTLVVAAPAAHAWNHTGHMIVAAIGHRETTPAARASASALLRQHPEHASRWVRRFAQERVPRAHEEAALFMLASRWPDDVRDDPRHHRGEWHYVNFTYRPRNAEPGPPPPGDNVLTALERSRRTLGDDGASAAEKAIALAWLFHLVGDMHQPLHTATLVSRQFPDGDRGGNSFFVRPGPRAEAITLHALWDGLPGRGDRIRDAANAATLLLSRPGAKRQDFPGLATRDAVAWARQESYEIAARWVYREGTLAGSPEPARAPVLPPDYARGAKAQAERRLVLAGYRLADLLASLLP
jgi:hypothetical protein